ncbi:MAG: hypothetical protein WC521_01050 [Bdellovibrionales bacterium]|jgi:hypothetical protein
MFDVTNYAKSILNREPPRRVDREEVVVILDGIADTIIDDLNMLRDKLDAPFRICDYLPVKNMRNEGAYNALRQIHVNYGAESTRRMDKTRADYSLLTISADCPRELRDGDDVSPEGSMKAEFYLLGYKVTRSEDWGGPDVLNKHIVSSELNVPFERIPDIKPERVTRKMVNCLQRLNLLTSENT